MTAAQSAQLAAIEVDTTALQVDTTAIQSDTAAIATVQGQTDRIDGLATDGLAGVHNSLAYRVHELEKHFHNTPLVYGDDGTSNFRADDLTHFTLGAGLSEAWGTAVALHDGTVIEGGSAVKRFDFHRVFVTGVNVADKNYMVEILYGTGAVGAAARLTAFYFRVGNVQFETLPITVMSPRIPCNNKLWARCKCELDSKTISLLFEVHTYES